MAIPVTRERVDYGSVDGSALFGAVRQVISGAAATRTLLASESGALVLLDRGTAMTFTLPVIATRDIGMWFEFLCTVIGTSSYSILTDSATTFIGGGIIGASNTVTAFDHFPATIASTVRIDLDSATTGEEVGSQFKLTALSVTTWGIGGHTVGTGTPVDPFA